MRCFILIIFITILSGFIQDACASLKEAWAFTYQQDYKQAFIEFKKYAQLGDKTAQRALGYFYENGLGTEKNFQEAFSWYKLSAEQEDLWGQYNLALLYEQGKGQAKDYSQARFWYQKAAYHNYTPAQYALGLYYEQGKGGKKDLISALYWYRQASIYGYEPALKNYNKLLVKSNTMVLEHESPLSMEKKPIPKEPIVSNSITAETNKISVDIKPASSKTLEAKNIEESTFAPIKNNLIVTDQKQETGSDNKKLASNSTDRNGEVSEKTNEQKTVPEINKPTLEITHSTVQEIAVPTENPKSAASENQSIVTMIKTEQETVTSENNSPPVLETKEINSKALIENAPDIAHSPADQNNSPSINEISSVKSEPVASASPVDQENTLPKAKDKLNETKNQPSNSQNVAATNSSDSENLLLLSSYKCEPYNQTLTAQKRIMMYQTPVIGSTKLGYIPQHTTVTLNKKCSYNNEVFFAVINNENQVVYIQSTSMD
ncbi:MAG: SEL1-like repeat protein [Alphaproteobacteria bacterium]|nr:SEL1-like repeat protein [Alphaproteobacteria bacterium]